MCDVLLCQEMLKYSQKEAGSEALQEAVESMLGVLKYVNDLMHQVSITGFPVSEVDEKANSVKERKQCW